MEKRFTDNGGTSRVMIEGNGAPLGGDFENNTYVLANHVSKSNRKMKNGIASENIGPGSNGFAAVATLATIIAFAGVIVAYLTLRY